MNKNSVAFGATLLLVLGVSQQAHAQNLLSRHSEINWSGVYGVSTNLGTPSNDLQSTALVANGGLSDAFIDTKVGSNWFATVGIDVHHSYTVLGSLNNFTSISATMSGAALAESNNAVATIGTEPPFGNGLVLEFEVTNAINYTISGGADAWQANPIRSAVILERWTGNAWVFEFHSTFTPNDPTSFLHSDSLNPGLYRLNSYAVALAANNENNTSTASYQFSVDPVPEPATLSILGLGALALLKKKKKK